MKEIFIILVLCIGGATVTLSQVMTSDNYCKKKHKSTYYRSSIKVNADSTYIIYGHDFHSSTLCSKDSSFIQSKVFLIYRLPGDSIYIDRKDDTCFATIQNKTFIQFPDSVFQFEMDRLSDNFYHHEILIHQEKYR